MFSVFTILFLTAVVGIVWPYYKLKRREFAWVAIASFILMMVTVPDPETDRETGQTAAATSMPIKDPVQMEKDNATQIASLKKEAGKIPATDIDANLRIYRQLSQLAPGNGDIVNKKAIYEGKARRRTRFRDNPEEALEIGDFAWSKGGFGSIMLIDRMTVKNEAPFAIKDFVVKCTHQGPSGTDMDSNTRRVYDIVPANGTKTVREINMGFIHSQVATTNCEITKADVA
jgi:hypothetical protein